VILLQLMIGKLPLGHSGVRPNLIFKEHKNKRNPGNGKVVSTISASRLKMSPAGISD
jgi:hypothetical protein